jgi:hypothetical protein
MIQRGYTPKLLLRWPAASAPPTRRPSKCARPLVVPPVPETKSRLGDAECEALRDALSQAGDLAGTDTARLRDLHAYLREYAVQCAMNEDFAEARSARALGERVYAELLRRAVRSDDRADLQAAAREREQSRQALWRERFEAFESESDQARSELIQRHEAERAEFETAWRVEKRREYQRPTSRLLQLKQIERSLAASGEIDRAEHVHAEAQRCAAAAAAEAQERLDRDYLFALERLLDRQRGELARFDAHADDRRQLLESDRALSDGRGRSRQGVVAMACARAARPRLGEECKALPAKMPRLGRVGRVLLPELLPPNIPERIRHRMESSGSTPGRRSASEATAGEGDAAWQAVAMGAEPEDPIRETGAEEPGASPAEAGDAASADPAEGDAEGGPAIEEGGEGPDDPGRVFQTMLDPKTMEDEGAERPTEEHEGVEQSAEKHEG